MKRSTTITFTCAIIVLTGVAAYLRLNHNLGPHVVVGPDARPTMESKIGKLPSSAHDFYFAYSGLQDPVYYFAVTIPASDIRKFFDGLDDVSDYYKDRAVQTLADLQERGPDSWSWTKRHSLWNAGVMTDLQATKTNTMLVLYSASSNRVFICIGR